MWLVARTLANEALHVAKMLATYNRLLPKVVQIEDDSEYKIDSILYH